VRRSLLTQDVVSGQRPGPQEPAAIRTRAQVSDLRPARDRQPIPPLRNRAPAPRSAPAGNARKEERQSPHRPTPVLALVLLAATAAASAPAALAQRSVQQYGTAGEEQAAREAPRARAGAQTRTGRAARGGQARSAEDDMADQLNAESLRRSQAGQGAPGGRPDMLPRGQSR
jgi:hypothetical protein